MSSERAHYRKCPLTGDRVVVAANRGLRPGAFVGWNAETPVRQACPFCPGNEDATPETLDQFPESGRWQVRVTSNKYPAFQLDASDEHAAAGSHEVIVETPRHLASPTQLSDEELAHVFRMYARRVRHHRDQKRWKMALVFRNQGGRAGASQPHPHSQLLALAEPPARVRKMLDAAESGVFTSLWRDPQLQVARRGDLVAFCPFASRAAGETWIMPTSAQPRFEESPDDQLMDAAVLIKSVAMAYEAQNQAISYNWILHTAPFDTRPHDHYHWSLAFIPRLTTLAGFEWATGQFINPLPPEQAASWLRSARSVQSASKPLPAPGSE